ncbi:MAG TPA: hypothetical protein VMR81_06765 [Patescibacteria group bacterium]|jgi:copper chaperone CopZ|nr:hypothetical protein [Patescibacteria group bacterium]
MIESDLEDAGVKATCSYAKQTLNVEYEEGKADEQMVKTVVKKSGYSIAS